MKLCSLVGLLVIPFAQGIAQTTTTTVAPAVCPDTGSVAKLRVCNAALDGVTMLHPLAALLISGGNPVLGTAGLGAGGKFTHVRIAFRVTRTGAVIPDLTYDGSSDTVSAKRRIRLYAQRVDLSAGLFHKVMPAGTVAVDFILSALIIPKGISSDFTPVQGSRTVGSNTVALDWGFRAGLISAKMPLLSLSVVKRGTPTVTVGRVTDTDLASYVFNASALNVRLFAGKNFRKVEFAAGAGVDLLGGSATVFYRDPDSRVLQDPIIKPLSGMRLITALDLGAVVGPMRFTGEGGYQAANNMMLTTKFAGNDTNAGRFYATIGASFVY